MEPQDVLRDNLLNFLYELDGNFILMVLKIKQYFSFLVEREGGL